MPFYSVVGKCANLFLSWAVIFYFNHVHVFSSLNLNTYKYETVSTVSKKAIFWIILFPFLEWANPCWLQRSGGKLPASSYKSGQKKGRERSQAGFESLPIPSGWIHQGIYKKRGIWAAQGKKLTPFLAYRMIKQCCSPRIRNLCYLRNLFHSILHYFGNTFHTQIMCITNSECWYTFLELFFI